MNTEASGEPGPEQKAWFVSTVSMLRVAGYEALDARRDKPEVVSVGAFGGQIEVFFNDKRAKTLRVTVAVWPPVSERTPWFRSGSPVLYDGFAIGPDGASIGED